MRSPYNAMESAEAHLYSVPMIGQLNFGNEFKPLPLGKDQKVNVTDEMVEGAKAIPGYLAGFTAMKLRKEGVKIPTFANRDVAYGIVGKIVSRVLLAYAISSLPEDIAASQVVLSALWRRQKLIIEALKGEENL